MALNVNFRINFMFIEMYLKFKRTFIIKLAPAEGCWLQLYQKGPSAKR